MKWGVLVVFIVCFSLLNAFALAEQTVKTVEIPFGFVSQTVADNVYEKDVTLSSPDGIERITHATINIRGDFQSGTKIYARVGSQECEPAGWTIPNVDSVNYLATFDCSGLLKDKTSGTFSLRFMTDKVAQNVFAGLVFTYYNDPKGSVSMMGTEYQIGDKATIFLQLKTINGYPVNDGECYLDIYYPQYNASHSVYVINSPMIYLNNSDGLYYFDLIAPNMTGVYMLSATCSYAYDVNWFFGCGDMRKSNITILQGTYYGDTINLNSQEDAVYMRCDSEGLGGMKYCEAYYDFNISTAIGSNITNIDLYYGGEATTDAYLQFYVYNWTNSSWVLLDNTLTFAGTPTGSAELGINDFMGNQVPMDDIIQNDIIRIKLYSQAGKTYSQYDNWLSLKLLTSEGGIQELKGSGEMHISNTSGSLNSSISGIAEKVWSYYNRTLTDYNQSRVFLFLDTINNTLVEVNETNWMVYNLILSVNNSLSSKIDSVQNAILSVNSSIINELGKVNQSIWGKLFLIQGELQDIQDDISDTYNLIEDVNKTIMWKLYWMQDEIASVNDTIKSANYTIMNKLYLLQDEIANMNQTIIDILVNITNATYNISLSQEEVIEWMFTLWEEKTGLTGFSGTRYAYAGIGTGFLSAMGLEDDGAEYSCIDNQTLERRYYYEYVFGDRIRIVEKTQNITCEFGCEDDMCNPSPLTAWFWVGILIMVVVVMIWLVTHYASKKR